jgi:hypothetical protein
MAANRARICLEMSLDGKTDKAIGAMVGLTRTGVIRAKEAALQRTLRPAADKYRASRLAKLEVAEEANWPGVMRGDIESIETHIKIDKRIADLTGTDAPAKMEHSGQLGISGEIAVEHKMQQVKELLRDPEFRAFASRRLARAGGTKS